MPAIMRFSMPASGRTLIWTAGSFHSRMWCSKKIDWPGASSTVSTGTSSPDRWKV